MSSSVHSLAVLREREEPNNCSSAMEWSSAESEAGTELSGLDLSLLDRRECCACYRHAFVSLCSVPRPKNNSFYSWDELAAVDELVQRGCAGSTSSAPGSSTSPMQFDAGCERGADQ